VHFLADLARNVEKLNLHPGRNHFLIAESDLNDIKYITPLRERGFGMDSQWCDEFHHALHARITGERNGYYSDFHDASNLVNSFNNAWVYDGKYSAYRKRLFGSSTKGIPGDRFVVCTQNHDQVGNRMLGERLGSLVDFETLKLAAGAMFMSPFIPMLFMGEEYGEASPFLYFTSHGDKGLIEAVREGRKKEFADFAGTGEPPDPHLEETFERSKLSWDFKDDRKAKLLGFYKKLIGLKRTHPALRPGNRENVRAVEAAGGSAIIVVASAGGDQGDPGEKAGGMLAAVMNFSGEMIDIPLAGGIKASFRVLLYSAHARWGGPVIESASLATEDGRIILEPGSILILSDNYG
jgi:maltooligosyltrehalose trehalohydrolase